MKLQLRRICMGTLLGMASDDGVGYTIQGVAGVQAV